MINRSRLYRATLKLSYTWYPGASPPTFASNSLSPLLRCLSWPSCGRAMCQAAESFYRRKQALTHGALVRYKRLNWAAVWPRTSVLHSCPAALRCKASKASPTPADGDESEEVTAGVAMRVERLLGGLGYGTRKEVGALVKQGRVTRADGGRVKVKDKVLHTDLLLDGEPLDAPRPLVLLLNKPLGYVVTSPDDQRNTNPTVYDLLPHRYSLRRPTLACVGRLDKETAGLLMLTDEGVLLHRINAPKNGIWKVYEAMLSDPLPPSKFKEVERRFASGTMMLVGDNVPLLPAKLTMVDDRNFKVAVCEGRYHQVRRMFATVGFEVKALRRVSVGGLQLADLPAGQYRVLNQQDVEAVFNGPTLEDVFDLPTSSRLLDVGMTPPEVAAEAAAASANELAAQTRTDHGQQQRGVAELDTREERDKKAEADEQAVERLGVTAQSYQQTIKWRLRRQMVKKILPHQL